MAERIYTNTRNNTNKSMYVKTYLITVLEQHNVMVNKILIAHLTRDDA